MKYVMYGGMVGTVTPDGALFVPSDSASAEYSLAPGEADTLPEATDAEAAWAQAQEEKVSASKDAADAARCPSCWQGVCVCE